MFKKLFLFVTYFGLVWSSDQENAQQEACLHLYKAAEIIGCHETPKMPLNTHNIFLCDQFYLISENDTCDLISQNLNVSIDIINQVVECDSLEANRLVCIRSDSATNETYKRFIEPFRESDLNFLDSSETTATFLETVIQQLENKTEDIELEIEEGLRQHNFYRKLHKVDELVYNETIANQAQKWAEHLASTKQLAHNYESPYGENIAQACGFPGFTGRY